MLRFLIISFSTLIASSALAQQSVPKQPATACPSGQVMVYESKTVFQDVSRFGRKHSAARNLTEKHEEMAKQGWSFQAQSLYTENSDIEGFFLTYSRPLGCRTLVSND